MENTEQSTHGAEGRTLILASQSPRRLELMSQLGLRFEVRHTDAEDGVTMTTGQPAAYARQAARLKAEHAAEGCGTALVIGADTIVVLDGEVLGKPSDDADALRMLSMLQGHTHQVITGLAVLDVREGQVVSGQVTHVATNVKMRAASTAELEAYVASGEPRDKAGAYAIQGLGAVFIEGIVGDYFNVVGLPLFTLAGILRGMGHQMPFSS